MRWFYENRNWGNRGGGGAISELRIGGGRKVDGAILETQETTLLVRFKFGTSRIPAKRHGSFIVAVEAHAECQRTTTEQRKTNQNEYLSPGFADRSTGASGEGGKSESCYGEAFR